MGVSLRDIASRGDGVGVGGRRRRPAWGREEPEVLSKADLGTHPNSRTARALAV